MACLAPSARPLLVSVPLTKKKGWGSRFRGPAPPSCSRRLRGQITALEDALVAVDLRHRLVGEGDDVYQVLRVVEVRAIHPLSFSVFIAPGDRGGVARLATGLRMAENGHLNTFALRYVG